MNVFQQPVPPIPAVPRVRTPERRGVHSHFMQALALFLAFNAYLSFCSPIHFDPYRCDYKGWAWWTMDDLRHSKEIHNVAVLGSSTMVSAMAGCDANFLNRILDLTRYHRLSYLDAQLTNKFGGSFNSFSLAAPGQMPSDAYLALKAMVASANRPDVVLYGLAPRDFIDRTLSGPNDTEPFKYLTRIVNIDDVAGAVFRSPWARLEWFIGRVLYMYGFASDFRLATKDGITRTLAGWLPAPFTNKPFTWWDRVRMLPAYMPGEIHPEAVMAGTIDEATARSQYKDNTLEYQQRYKSPDPRTYRTQMFFLHKLAQYCHKERIELVLANMPITFYNANMLRPGIYIRYVQALKEFAIMNDIVFYDLCDFSKYHQEDFHDSVHLNAFGARKFFDALVAMLTVDQRPSAKLAISGLELQHHTALAAGRGGTY
jgi:hypothetical protein